MKRQALAVALVLLAACSSGVPKDSREKTARISGMVIHVDRVAMLIHLVPPDDDDRMRDIPAIRYNSLTIVDRAHRPSNIDDLLPGEKVLIFGREDLQTGEITADRVVVEEPRRTSEPPKPEPPKTHT
jgi:hypothetical protein